LRNPQPNRWSLDRFAAGGRPGDGTGARPRRSDWRFRRIIATSRAQVLRRSFESAQYTSVAFGNRCKKARLTIDRSTWRRLRQCDVRKLLRHARMRTARPPSLSIDGEARMAVFHFIEGIYSPSRRHSALGYLSPIEYERKRHGLIKPAQAPRSSTDTRHSR
jgi:putative transposase